MSTRHPAVFQPRPETIEKMAAAHMVYDEAIRVLAQGCTTVFDAMAALRDEYDRMNQQFPNRTADQDATLSRQVSVKTGDEKLVELLEELLSIAAGLLDG